MSKIIVVQFPKRADTFLRGFQASSVALPITCSPSNIIFPVGRETKAWISGLTSIQYPGWNAWSCTSITHTSSWCSAYLTQEKNELRTGKPLSRDLNFVLLRTFLIPGLLSFYVVLATLVTFVLHARSTKLDPQNEE
jgi:hypothetical protein